MIKVITMMKRREGLTPEEFNRYWNEKHIPLAQRVIPDHLAPEKYILNHAVRFGDAFDPSFDGIGALCFSDRQRFQEWKEWFLSDEGRILREDELHFVDPGTKISLVGEERVIVEEKEFRGRGRASGEAGEAVKLMAMLKRRDGMSLEEFGRHWHEDHGPMAVRVIPDAVRIRRYVQNHMVGISEEEEPFFDGIVEFCLEGMDSLEAWMAFYTSDAGKVIRDDELRFIDMKRMMVVMVEESVFAEMPGRSPS